MSKVAVSKPRVYEYVVTDVWGEGGDPHVKPGTHIFENHYRGRTTDWNVMNLESGKMIWGFTGKFLQKRSSEPTNAEEAANAAATPTRADRTQAETDEAAG